MTTTSGDVVPRPADTWRDALELIAESAADLLGFAMAAVSLVDDDVLRTVAVVGVHPDDRDTIMGRTPSVDRVMAALEGADDWGRLRFMPHDRVPADLAEGRWVPPVPSPPDVGEVWHPQDALVTPLHASDGELLGLLALGVPNDGLVPAPEQRPLLDEHVAQASRAVVSILERERLAQQLALATAARRLIRDATGHRSVAELLASVEHELLRSFRGTGLWIQVFEDVHGSPDRVLTATGNTFELPTALRSVARETAERFWRLQEANVVGVDDPPPVHLSEEEHAEIRAFQRDHDIHATLFTPLGAGPRCLGNLVITRGPGDPHFTEAERQLALEMGHDLGLAVVHTQIHERRHQLVTELQALDTYKTQLIATLAHELKNPLTAVTGYLEVLEAMPSPGPAVQGRLASISTNGAHMERLVNDMLTLSRLADPGQALNPTVVSLRSVAGDALEGLAVEAGALTVTLPDDAVLVHGDAVELARLCRDLSELGLARSPEGGRVQLTLDTDGGEAVLTCVDGGPGLSVEERALFFTEFARAARGDTTGLATAIARRIVERHRGTIEVVPGAGHGVTVRVRLPLSGELS